MDSGDVDARLGFPKPSRGLSLWGGIGARHTWDALRGLPWLAVLVTLLLKTRRHTFHAEPSSDSSIYRPGPCGGCTPLPSLSLSHSSRGKDTDPPTSCSYFWEAWGASVSSKGNCFTLSFIREHILFYEFIRELTTRACVSLDF